MLKLREKVWRTLLVLFCCMVSAQAWADVTIYVSKTYDDGYPVPVQKVKICEWGQGSDPIYGPWPGTLLTNVPDVENVTLNGRDWWKVTVNVDSKNDRTFHGAIDICDYNEDGTAHDNHRSTYQTGDITIPDNGTRYIVLNRTKMMEKTDLDVSNVEDLPDPVSVAPNFHVYVRKIDGKENAYGWIGDGDDATKYYGVWPGSDISTIANVTEASKYDATWYDIPVYYTMLDNDDVKIIINNGNGNQTNNIIANENTYITLNTDNWSDSYVFSYNSLYVVGDNRICKNGYSVNPDGSQKMTTQEGGATFTWHSQYVYLSAGETLNFRVLSTIGNAYPNNNDQTTEAVTEAGLYLLQVTYTPHEGVTYNLKPIESTDEPHHYIYVSTKYKNSEDDVDINNTYFYNWGPETFGYWPGTSLSSFPTVDRLGKKWYVIPVIPEMTTTDGIIHAIFNINGNDQTQSGNLDLNFDTYIELNNGNYSGNNNLIYGEPKFYVFGDNAEFFGGVWKEGVNELTPNDDKHTEYTWQYGTVYMNGGETIYAKFYREQVEYTFNDGRIQKNTVKEYYPRGQWDNQKIQVEQGAAGSYQLRVEYDCTKDLDDGSNGGDPNPKYTLTRINVGAPRFYIVNDANWKDMTITGENFNTISLDPDAPNYDANNNKYNITGLENYNGQTLTLNADGHSMVLNGLADKRIYRTSHPGMDTYTVNGQDLNLNNTNAWAPTVDEQDWNQWQDYTNLMSTSDNVHYTWISEPIYPKTPNPIPQFQIVKNGVAWYPSFAVNTANGYPEGATPGTYCLKVTYNLDEAVGPNNPSYEWVEKRPTIYVYDFANPKLYVNVDGEEPNGTGLGKNLINLDFTVGGTRGTNATADGTTEGIEALGWYKYELPAGTTDYTFKVTHVGDATVITSDEITVTGGENAYVYWQGQETNTQNERENGQYVKITKEEASTLHRIVVHVLAENSTMTYTIPGSESVPKTLENPASFYGKLYFWKSFTILEDEENHGGLKGMKINVDGTEYNAPAIFSDVYFKLSNPTGDRIIPLSELEADLYDKPGRGELGKTDDPNAARGTVIHLLKNDITPPTRVSEVDGQKKYLTISTNWRDTSPHASSNVGSTWWGDDYTSSLNSDWMGKPSNPDDVKVNYYESRFMCEGDSETDYYTITAYDGTEWYTWYSDRSVAIPRFTYALPNTPDNNYTGRDPNNEYDITLPHYPISLNELNVIINDHPNNDNYQRSAFPFHDQENMLAKEPKDIGKDEKTGFSDQTTMGQVGGEVWLVWYDDNSLEEVTRDYESRAYQKPLCAVDDPFGYGEENHPYYIYYTDINGWDEVFIQIWGRGNDDITVQQVLHWPGLQMQLCGYDEEGHPIYVVDLTDVIDEIVALYAPDVTYDNVDQFIGGLLFNNGVQDGDDTNKRQSSDMVFENGGCYDYLGLIGREGGVMDLRGVWYSRVTGTLFAKGTNDFSKKSINFNKYPDAAHEIPVDENGTTLLKNDDKAGSSLIDKTDYDQSNWYELRLPARVDLTKAIGPENEVVEGLYDLVNKNFRVVAKRVNKDSANPLLDVVELLSYSEDIDPYPLNPYIPANFNGETVIEKNAANQEAYDHTTYFFVEPKPCEFAVIYFSVYDINDNDYFFSPKNVGFPATIDVDWKYYDPAFEENDPNADYSKYSKDHEHLVKPGDATIKPHLNLGGAYSGWLAVIKLNEGDIKNVSESSSKAGEGELGYEVVPAAGAEKDPMKYIVYPIRLDNNAIITAIEDVKGDIDHGTVVRTRYYNMMGIESSTPFQGVNIVVKEYSDGTRQSSKILK